MCADRSKAGGLWGLLTAGAADFSGQRRCLAAQGDNCSREWDVNSVAAALDRRCSGRRNVALIEL